MRSRAGAVVLTVVLAATPVVSAGAAGVSVGDPCQARAHHGFNGIETRVVEAIAAFAR